METTFTPQRKEETLTLDHKDLTWRTSAELVVAGLEFEFHPRNDDDRKLVRPILEELWERFPGLELLTYDIQRQFSLVPEMYITFHILNGEGLFEVKS